VKRPLKIAVVSASIYPYQQGGIARWMTDVVPSLISQGHDVRLITRQHSLNDPRPYLLTTPEQPTVSLLPEAFPHIDKFSSGVLEVIDNLADNGWQPDVVYGTAWDCEVLAVIRSKRYFVVSLVVTPLRVTIKHSGILNPDESATFSTMQDLEKESIEHSDAVHAISNSIVATLTSEYSIDFASLLHTVIPLGLPLTIDKTHKNRHPKVLFVGRREERKGIDLLLDAIPNIIEKYPNTRFTIAGQESPSAKRSETYEAEFRREQSWRVLRKVKFLAQVSDQELQKLYERHEITCVPSRYESFGLVAVEAMRGGSIPVVAPGSGLEEIVVNQKNGLVMQQISSAALEQEIELLLSNYSLLHELRRAAKNSYVSSFQIDTTTKKLISFFQENLK
jgi:glycosyltransferase involved in cell wall biosynthesis